MNNRQKLIGGGQVIEQISAGRFLSPDVKNFDKALTSGLNVTRATSCATNNLRCQ